MKISIINTPFSILYKARTDLRTGSRTGSQQGSQIGSHETCEPNRTANRFAKPVREPNFANRPNPSQNTYILKLNKIALDISVPYSGYIPLFSRLIMGFL